MTDPADTYFAEQLRLILQERTLHGKSIDFRDLPELVSDIMALFAVDLEEDRREQAEAWGEKVEQLEQELEAEHTALREAKDAHANALLTYAELLDDLGDVAHGERELADALARDRRRRFVNADPLFPLVYLHEPTSTLELVA